MQQQAKLILGLGALLLAGCSVYDESLVGSGGAAQGGAAPTGSGGSGAAGGTGGAGGSGGAGECSVASDCPGADTECQARTCNGGACGVTHTPGGTPLAQQTAGDCQETQCDGSGGVVQAADDADPPDDAEECTADSCSQGAPVHTPLPGSICSQGGIVCNAMGECVECTSGAQCPSGVCTAQYQCAAPACDDMVQNGAESDVDCGGPVCAPCATGLMCGAGTDCIGGLCTGGTCQPTCTDTQKNNAETDVDCGGPVCAPCQVGQICTGNSDCTTNSCIGAACACSGTYLLISEVRPRGPAMGNDEFVELYNPTSMPIVLDSEWTIEARGSSAMTYGTRWTGNGATIAPHGHYLIVGSAYSGMTGGDATLTTGISDASSVRLVHTAQVIDAICFYYSMATLDDFMTGVGFTCEGTPVMNPAGTSNVDESMERRPGGALGSCTDAGDNAADFRELIPAQPQSTASPPTP